MAAALLIAFAVSAATLVTPLQAQANQASSDAALADTLAGLERDLANAMHARDRARLEQILAPDYILRGTPDIDRDTWVRNAVSLCWGERSDIDDLRVQPLGDVAIVSLDLTFYVNPDTCRPAVLRSLITDVWVRSGGAWQLQTRHSGPPPTGGIAAQFGAVPETPPTWDLGSEVSVVATAGTTSTRTVGLGASALHRAGAGTTQGSVSFLTTEVDQVPSARVLTVRGRQGYRVSPRLELFGDGLYGRDRFAGIGHRVVTSAGAAYTAPLPRRHALTSEGSLGYSAEQRLDGAELRYPIAIGTVRYRWTITPGTTLAQDVGFNADLDIVRNWRGTSATVLSIALTRLLSLNASQTVEYRNQPVAGFGRTDLRSSVVLAFAFRR
ncbi:MAG: DUF481 domain-containing protein [Vicinamibacterales bacterium]